MSHNSRTIPAEKLSAIKSFGTHDAEFHGDFKSDSPEAGFRLDGTLTGTIKFPYGGTVHVGPSARVLDGCIEADFVFVEGFVQGSIHARKAVEISTNATVVGAIKYDSELDIHKNAKIRGAVEFTGEMELHETTGGASDSEERLDPAIAEPQAEVSAIRQNPPVVQHLINPFAFAQPSSDQLAA